MSIANHMIVGAGIASVLSNPFLVLPLAFVSHFVLDAIPHYGYKREGYAELMKHRLAYVANVLSILGVVAMLFVVDHTWLSLAAALLALSPDFEWPYRYFFFERKNRTPPTTPFTQFHKNIQWCERPWGLIVEIIFYCVVFSALAYFN